jgi:hypothetical protein
VNRSLGHEAERAGMTPALFRAQALGRVDCSWHTLVCVKITLSGSE